VAYVFWRHPVYWGHIPTSGDITVCTIEKHDSENMGKAFGIFTVCVTELAIHVGGG